MRMFILCFVSGVMVLQCQPALPAHPVWLLAAACAIGIAPRGLSVSRVRLVATLVSGLLMGFAWAAWIAHVTLEPGLRTADEGQDVTIVGTIANLPYRFEQGVRFNFAVEKVEAPALVLPPQLALSWYSGFRNEVTEVGDVQPGERWRLTVRLQRPHGSANPLGFDYEVWLLEQGIRATGYVRPAAGNRRLESFVFSFGNVVEHCRAVLRARILRALPGKPYAGVIVALVVGDQRSIGLVADIKVLS